MINNLKILWIPPSTNLKSASLRLRGHTCGLYQDFSKADVLIISKKYDSNTIESIKSFREINPESIIIFDICDNHFYSNSIEPNGIKLKTERVTQLLRVISLVDAVTTSSDYLSKIIINHSKNDQLKVFAIDDFYEVQNSNNLFKSPSNLIAAINYFILKLRLNYTNKQAERFVWFGTHGVSYADGGMLDLVARSNVIKNEFKTTKSTLTIISNSYIKYRRISKSLGVKTFYLPWHPFTFDRALRLHTFKLLPIKHNEFTLSKSSNRPVTAILNKLIVICDTIPSYLKLNDFLIKSIDTTSLNKAIHMPEIDRLKLIDSAYDHVKTNYSLSRISEIWETNINKIINEKSKEHGK
jgi:hypothetical protein